MKIILGVLLALTVQNAPAADKKPEPAKKEAPVPEKIPAKTGDADAPSVRIRTSENGDVVEEYRQGGVVTMVKVTPTRGKPYYIMDNNGDGRLDRADAEAAGGVVPVSWVIATWQLPKRFRLWKRSEMSELRISSNRADVDLDVVHEFLSRDAYWSKNIPRAVVEKSIENSWCFSAFVGERQVGFARVVSDGATFAYLCDVFTLPEFRGRGIGKELMQSVQSHPELQGLRRWMLMTADAHKLYENYGFSALAKPDRAMEISKPDIYL